MNKKFLPLIFFLLIPIYGCGNSNTKTGTSDIQISQEGMVAGNFVEIEPAYKPHLESV